jgi:hypothetical protein
MYGSKIYKDFTEDIYWIREQIQADVRFFPDSMKPLVEHYIKKRLLIIPSKERIFGSSFDYELGRPVPYATFWFADAFGLKDEAVWRELGLGLLYSALATTIRDDIIDGEGPQDPRRTSLLNFYNHRYLEIFDSLFPRDSSFWYHLSRGIQETARYESWNLLFDKGLEIDPFSEAFLQESSRYFSAVVMPTLAALAVLTGNEGEVEVTSRFLRHFSMGWRIYDDFCDWKKDLKRENVNHSSILLYSKQRIQGITKLNEKAVHLMFLDTNFINDSYGAILRLFTKAKRDVTGLDCEYLDKFMDEQLSFHSRRRKLILERSGEVNSGINEKLRAILGL